MVNFILEPMENWIKREAHIIAHGQSKMFRIIKWVILVVLGALVYAFFGGKVLGWTIFILAILGISAHFLFRWKTRGWTKDWWLYKATKTPFDGNP